MNFYPKTKYLRDGLIRFFLLVCCAYLGGSSLLPLEAQKKRSNACSKLFVQQYEAAKRLFQEGTYAAAKEQFQALRSVPDASVLTPYIHFYYGLSAYRNGEKALAQSVFSELCAQFPAWDKRNEAHYWVAQCLFESGHVEEALQQLAQIRDKRMVAAVLQLKQYFLKQLDDMVLLQRLLRTFPEDDVIRKILFQKAACEAYYRQDISLIRQLEEQYHCSIQEYDPLRKLTSKRKEVYSVAVLLPFLVEGFNYETCSDAFVVELYQGIRLGVKQLAAEGIALKLYAFDTQNDASVTAELLKQEALKQMDLIVGPLYPTTIPLVADFARKHKINFVNPISSNEAVVRNHPFAFLLQPSFETQVQKAVQLTLLDITSKSIEDPFIAIFYTPNEAHQAHAYKQQIEASLGKKVGCLVELPNTTAVKNFLTHLEQEPTSSDTEGNAAVEKTATPQLCTEFPSKHALKKMTHIYIPSSQPFLVSSMVNLSFKLRIRPQIIGHEQWLKKELLTLDQLTKLPIWFLAPNYMDFMDPKVRALHKQFVQQTGVPPTLYSYTGYELICFVGRMLDKYGTYFQKEWGNACYFGTVFQGFFYGSRHDNQHIPVVRFVADRFVLVPTPALELKNENA
ncbi:MAG TPA: tetratricopeptide repeat protein [Amoebophilaceae bacterium]|jgi:tetratricopeptide (TPR) repeat protein|nr:tetratricopeptide repeat protein [Amoebophilaceae bacterium]